MYIKIAKIMLWVIIVLLLLPGNETEKREMRGTAQRTVDEFGEFCTRNAAFCDSFQAAYDALYDKMRYGAQLIEDLFRDHVAPEDAPPAPRKEGRDALSQNYSDARAIRDSLNTLRQDDLAPSWRGPRNL